MTNEHVETVNSFGSASSTCSSASSASSSATSATSSSTSNESISGRPYISELDLGLVFTDLKHLSNTLSLLARQIDQVVNIIDNKFGNVIASLDASCQTNTKRPVNFTKIINSSSCGHLLGTLNGNFKSRCNQCNQTLSPSKPELYQHQPDQPLLNLNSKKQQNNNNNKLNNEALLSNLLNASEMKTEMRSVSDRKNNHQMHNQQSSETTNSLKIKCPRSKSQPAFKETASNFNNCQNNSPSNFHYPTCSSNNAANLNKYLVLEANRLTSSPICSFNNMNNMTSSSSNPNAASLNGDTTTIYSNMAASTIAAQTGLLNDSSNAESSFYEDQLDNELESISNVPNNTKRQVPNGSANQSCAAQKVSVVNSAAPTPPLAGLVTNQPTPVIKTTQSNKQKSSNSNHHVSFNINNAIYTSRQDTPIPISILKPAQLSTSINKANQIENGEKMYQPQQQQQQVSTLSSPLQSSLKKNQNLNGSDLEQSNKQCKQNKTVRIDSKTTIL